jgi:hypothetical protein
MPWSVFLQDESLPLPAEKIGRLVHQAAGGVVYDHIQHVHLHYGHVARGLEEGQADALVALLDSSNFPALKKDEERLVKAETKIRVQRALLLEDALYFPAGSMGELKPAPWSSVSLVSIGSIVFRSRKEVRTTRGTLGNIGLGMGLITASVTTGIPIRMFPRPVRIERTSFKEVIEEAILIHIIFSGPPFVVEIRPKGFDYGYLGSRLAAISRENLGTLLGDLVRLAASAHWTRMSRTFLETGKLAPDFKDDKDFLRFNQWIAEVAGA